MYNIHSTISILWKYYVRGQSSSPEQSCNQYGTFVKDYNQDGSPIILLSAYGMPTKYEQTGVAWDLAVSSHRCWRCATRPRPVRGVPLGSSLLLAVCRFSRTHRETDSSSNLGISRRKFSDRPHLCSYFIFLFLSIALRPVVACVIFNILFCSYITYTYYVTHV